MLPGLKVSFLVWKCVFYRPDLLESGDPMKLHFEGFEMKHTNG